MGMEIEKKYLVKALPEDVERFPYHEITQGYLSRQPALRVRREAIFASGEAESSKERWTLTYKGIRTPGVLSQEEYNLPLTAEAYAHLLEKADGAVIDKRRVILPLNVDAFDAQALGENPGIREWLAGGDAKIELDIFKGVFQGLVIAEVEFPSERAAALYHPARWFGDEVTGDPHYSNAWLTGHGEDWKTETGRES